MTYRFDKIPPPPKTDIFQEQYRWNYRVFELLNGVVKLLATEVEVTPIDSITATDVQGAVEQLITLTEAHKTRHQNGGADEISVAGLSGLLADSQTPLDHASSHQNDGDDEISVAGLSGELADDQPPKAHGNEKHSSTFEDTANKDDANGYAGLNASSRVAKGVDTTDDLVVDSATKGLVLKDTQGTPHYWRVTVNTSGALVISDLGTSKP